jgi:hypothetical protein
MKTSLDIRAAVAMVLIVGQIVALSGCGRVAANYPEPARADPKRPPPHSARYAGLSIQVADRIDYAALRRNAASVRDQMKAGMGDAAYSAMRARTRERAPWTTRFREDMDHAFHRGTLHWPRSDGRIISEGLLVLTMQVAGDTITVRDRGILVLVGEDQADWRFTGNGPVDLSVLAAGTGGEADLPIIIRMPTAGLIIAAGVDSTRILVP